MDTGILKEKARQFFENEKNESSVPEIPAWASWIDGSKTRDKRQFAFLMAMTSQEEIERARGLLGNRKPFVFNLAKILKVDLPGELALAHPSEVQQLHIPRLKELRAQFAAKALATG